MGARNIYCRSSTYKEVPPIVGSSPTNRFTISEPHEQEIGKFYVAQKRHATDFEAPKL